MCCEERGGSVHLYHQWLVASLLDVKNNFLKFLSQMWKLSEQNVFKSFFWIFLKCMIPMKQLFLNHVLHSRHKCIYEYDTSEGLYFCWEWICWLQIDMWGWVKCLVPTNTPWESSLFSFAWKTAWMYEFVIQCMGCDTSYFCLGFKNS